MVGDAQDPADHLTGPGGGSSQPNMFLVNVARRSKGNTYTGWS